VQILLCVIFWQLSSVEQIVEEEEEEEEEVKRLTEAEVQEFDKEAEL
jgi:hypothetical protein